MKEKKLLLIVLLLTGVVSSFTAKVDMLLVKSPSMNKGIKVVVVVPDATLGEKVTACPIVYLLHGFGDYAKTQIKIKPNLPQIADEKGIIFVCPDRSTSWYWNSLKDPSFRYETFISSELVKYIDGHYKTITDRKGHAITGLSMGGYGGLWATIRYKDTFGTCGDTNGGVDTRPFPKNWDMAEHLGGYESSKEIWDTHTVINQIDKIQNGDLAIISNCGKADFFIQVSKDPYDRLLEKKTDHDFITRPGGHTREYWNNAIGYRILFFDKFFRK